MNYILKNHFVRWDKDQTVNCYLIFNDRSEVQSKKELTVKQAIQYAHYMKADFVNPIQVKVFYDFERVNIDEFHLELILSGFEFDNSPCPHLKN